MNRNKVLADVITVQLIILRMGAVQSKKDGIVKKYQLKVELKSPIFSELLDLTNWSFADIKQAYDIFCRSNNDCPYIDFFIFHKLMPFSTEVSKNIFNIYTKGEKYANIFQLICILILMSYNNYRKKLQMIFVLFDFSHLNRLTNKELILVFQSTINGFCRITGQRLAKYQYMDRYCIERFLRVSTLEALERVVTYRRLIQEVEGNSDNFQLFKRFDQQIYSYFTQESYIFRVNQYKKYAREDIQKIYRVIKKVSLDKNYEEVELVQKNRRFRLQNRKINCIKQLLQEKEEKYKQPIGSIKSSRTKSIASSSIFLPSLASQRQSQAKLLPKLTKLNTIESKLHSQAREQKKQKKILLLNGKMESKEDIFQTIKYFKNLSGNKPQIKVKQFFKSFDKKAFVKKQISSLFKVLDLNNKGQIDFQTFLKAFYHNITQADIGIIKNWALEYKTLHQADHFDINQLATRREKKGHMQLPKNTMKRIDQIFGSIDKEKKGFLLLQDLKQAYSTGFTIKELEDMLKQFGTDNRIYKQGFIKMTLPQNWSIEGTPFVGV